MITKNQILKTKSVIDQEQTKFKAFQIYADMSKVDRTWEQYGYLKAPLAVRKENGELSSRSHKSQVLILNNDFRKLLSNVYAVIPHQFISEMLNKYVLKNLDDLKLHIDKEYDAHDGDSHYWTLLSDKKFKLDGHDNFQFGISLRNGIGTNVSFGADFYTMRVVCTNGAVARGRNFGSVSIPHLGKELLVSKIIERVIRSIYQKHEQFEILYTKMTQIKVNDELATKIYKKMPYASVYLPSNWNIASRYFIKEMKEKGKYTEDMNLVEVTGGGRKTQTLMEVFNEITEKQRDGLRTGRINFSAVSTHQVGLHNAMAQIVATSNSNKKRI